MPETLSLFECRAAFHGLPFGGLLPTALRDAHWTYSRLLALLQIFGTVKAAVAGIPIGGAVEDLLVPLQRSPHLGGVGGIAVQHLVVGDQACALSARNTWWPNSTGLRALPRWMIWVSMTRSPNRQYSGIC
jgi:hypothetical protein